MRTLAVTNQKGGSGKTTTAVSLAAALGERNRKALFLDLDPQASSSFWYGIRDEGRGLLDVFTDKGNLLDLVRNTATANVELVPASEWLVSFEKDLVREAGAETILRRHLDRLPKDRWHYLLLDCPPALGLLTVNALAAVREVLVPVEAHVMALEGLVRPMKTVEVVRDRLNPGLEVTAIVPCRVDFRTRHAQDVVEELRKRFGKTVTRTVIRENVGIAEAPSFYKPITQYDSSSHGAEDYRLLAGEILRQERRA